VIGGTPDSGKLLERAMTRVDLWSSTKAPFTRIGEVMDNGHDDPNERLRTAARV